MMKESPSQVSIINQKNVCFLNKIYGQTNKSCWRAQLDQTTYPRPVMIWTNPGEKIVNNNNDNNNSNNNKTLGNISVLLTIDWNCRHCSGTSNWIFSFANISGRIGWGHLIQDERLVKGINLSPIRRNKRVYWCWLRCLVSKCDFKQRKQRFCLLVRLLFKKLCVNSGSLPILDCNHVLLSWRCPKTILNPRILAIWRGNS